MFSIDYFSQFAGISSPIQTAVNTAGNNANTELEMETLIPIISETYKSFEKIGDNVKIDSEELSIIEGQMINKAFVGGITLELKSLVKTYAPRNTIWTLLGQEDESKRDDILSLSGEVGNADVLNLFKQTFILPPVYEDALRKASLNKEIEMIYLIMPLTTINIINLILEEMTIANISESVDALVTKASLPGLNSALALSTQFTSVWFSITFAITDFKLNDAVKINDVQEVNFLRTPSSSRGLVTALNTAQGMPNSPENAQIRVILTDTINQDLQDRIGSSDVEAVKILVTKATLGALQDGLVLAQGQSPSPENVKIIDILNAAIVDVNLRVAVGLNDVAGVTASVTGASSYGLVSILHTAQSMPESPENTQIQNILINKIDANLLIAVVAYFISDVKVLSSGASNKGLRKALEMVNNRNNSSDNTVIRYLIVNV